MRKNTQRGFSRCDTCSTLRFGASHAKSKDERDSYQRLFKEHQTGCDDDRGELARIARLSKIDKRHLLLLIDAIDSNKFGIPSTEAQAKMLSKIYRVKQKLTGAMSMKDEKLRLFRTLPDVPTGGNLTLTILTFLFNTDMFDTLTDLYLNVDGASDNVCYTVFWGLAFLLLCAKLAGWPLRRIHLLRLEVGHTHNQLDGLFGLLSKFFYGKLGTTAVDILSFGGFDKVCE